MHKKNPKLFVEINELNYIFIVVGSDLDQNFKIVESIETSSEGFGMSNFTNIDIASLAIKKNIEIIENKLNYVFKEVSVIIDSFKYSCVNISGFKKLNGSQVQKENISYILNSLKSAVIENEKEKTILHIFNSKSVLDTTEVENLPIGLFGDFYNHALTFFLIKNNDLKNINLLFAKINLGVAKVFLKSFSEGVQLVNEKNVETFFMINVHKNCSKIIFFDHASFRFSENFDFGTDLIIKDIAKICSLDIGIVRKFLLDNLNKNKKINSDEYLEKDYFKNNNYRKIRKKLIFDIANARIDEIVDIIFKKNINIKTLKKNNSKIYLVIDDELISKNFQQNFNKYFSQNNKFESNLISKFGKESSVVNTANLLSYGWKKEAIPVLQTKKSIITRIFKTIFD